MGIGQEIQNLQDYFESFNPVKIYWTIIVCIWVEYFFELYLCLRQRRVYFESENKIPVLLKSHMNVETFEKARLYGIDKNNFTIVSELYGMIVLTALLHYEGLYKGWVLTAPMLSSFGYWPTSWDLEIGRSIAFSILAMGFNNIVGLPLAIYSTFVLEEKHGSNSNNQTLAFFAKNFVKKIVVSIIITSLIVGLIVKIVHAGSQYFFVWLWVFCFVVLMFLMTIYRMLIAPLFDKYTSLKEGPLRSRIEALAARISFPLTKLYVVEGSKRSAHSITYLYGFFNNKRIVLYVTLIKGYVSTSPSENKDKKEDEQHEEEKEEKGCDDLKIEAGLGHEQGHRKLNYVGNISWIKEIMIILIIFNIITPTEAYSLPLKLVIDFLITTQIIPLFNTCGLLFKYFCVYFPFHGFLLICFVCVGIFFSRHREIVPLATIQATFARMNPGIAAVNVPNAFNNLDFDQWAFYAFAFWLDRVFFYTGNCPRSCLITLLQFMITNLPSPTELYEAQVSKTANVTSAPAPAPENKQEEDQCKPEDEQKWHNQTQ